MDKRDILLVLSIINGTAIVVGLGLYLGTKWIDRMLDLKPRDPKKPIVRR